MTCENHRVRSVENHRVRSVENHRDRSVENHMWLFEMEPDDEDSESNVKYDVEYIATTKEHIILALKNEDEHISME